MEQLLAKACFEEVRAILLVCCLPIYQILKSGMSTTGEVGKERIEGTCICTCKEERMYKHVSVPSIDYGRSEKAGERCYDCGMSSHLLKNCSYPKQGRASREALGKKDSAVGINTVIVGTKRKEKIEN